MTYNVSSTLLYTVTVTHLRDSERLEGPALGGVLVPPTKAKIRKLGKFDAP